MLTEESLSKFSKLTELFVTQIEDDSSGTGDEEQPGTVVKILHLSAPVEAHGSIPTPSGGIMKVKDKKVYVAADDWKRFMKEAVETADGIVYRGQMHLDVSKPRTRTNNRTGQVEATSHGKIWLRSVKFSRSRGTLQQNGFQQTNNFINKLFAEGNVFDLTGELPQPDVPKVNTETPPVKENEPLVVENQEKAGAGGKKGK